MAKQTSLKQLFTDPLQFAFTIAGFLIGALVFYGVKHHFSSEQWATWVQAIGSMSAIWVSLALVLHQINHQHRAEKSREAKNDFRIACFAESVIREALDAVRAVKQAQDAWQDSDQEYVFHEKSRIHAAQMMTRTLAAEPLFAELIKPVIEMHALLVSVESMSQQLAGTGSPRNDHGLAPFWTQANHRMSAIAGATEAAIEVTRRSLPAD